MASDLIARIDTDGNGTLDEEEFLTVNPLLLLDPTLTLTQLLSLNNQQLKKTDINKTTPQLLGWCKSGRIWIFGALGNQLIWGSVIFVHSVSRVSSLKDIALRWHFFLHNGL